MDILNPWADSDDVHDVHHDDEHDDDDDDAWRAQQWHTSVAPVVQHPPLDTLLRHCQAVSIEIWPDDESSNEQDWRSGFDNLNDIATFLAPSDATLPPTLQFSTTATAKAMNEALKLTRHLPASAISPLSRLLASRGSLDWQKSVKTAPDVVLDATRVGWRVLEKQDRIDDSKPKKPPSGFLSFWNRRASTNQFPETPTTDRPPSRSSVESSPRPPSSHAPSPPPPPDIVATTPAPSAVSRFLNRFSRPRTSQHSALALSSDDIEFLSDIVPSACDPPDLLDGLTAPISDAPLPPKLPPPPAASPLVLGTPKLVGNANIPVLAPPPSPKPTATPPSLSPSPRPSILQPIPRLSPPRNVSPPQMVPPLAIPPLLPPPPISPPQTPRPGIIPPNSDPYESDDEFSAFTSFPAPAALNSHPPLRSPSPPSPPPRRTYERTHYPSSSSASSIHSPASADQLCAQSFDDVLSPPSSVMHTPPPPPLPAKRGQLPQIDTFARGHYPNQSFASPTAHTSLMAGVFSASSGSDGRTRAFLGNAAAHQGLTWPNLPDADEPRVKTIPPPPSSGIDLLGDSDAFGLPAPLSHQPRPRQTGGLSAQDLSFFEGL